MLCHIRGPQVYFLNAYRISIGWEHFDCVHLRTVYVSYLIFAFSFADVDVLNTPTERELSIAVQGTPQKLSSQEMNK